MDVEDLLGEDDAHVGELDEVLRARVGVRAGVDQHRRPALRGDHDRDPGAEDARKPPHVEEGRGEDGTGVPGRDDRRRVAVADRPDGAHERRVGLGPHRLRRLLVHGDRLGADDELEPVRVERRPGPKRTGSIVLEAACDGARDDLVRGVVATERVDRDANDRPGGPDDVDWPGGARQAPPLRRGRPQRLDLATAVRLARRADAVRLLRRAAVLARRDARRGDRVLGAALVAPGLRGLSLRDGHERPPVYLLAKRDSARRIPRLDPALRAGTPRRRPLTRSQALSDVMRSSIEEPSAPGSARPPPGSAGRARRRRARRPSVASACSSCSTASRSRWFVGSSSTRKLTPAAWSSARWARVRSPGERVSHERPTWSAPRPNLASSVRASTGRRPLRSTKRPSSVSPDRVGEALLPDDARDHASAEPTRARGEIELSEEGARRASSCRSRSARRPRARSPGRTSTSSGPRRNDSALDDRAGQSRDRRSDRGRTRGARAGAPTARTASPAAGSARAAAPSGAPSCGARSCRGDLRHPTSHPVRPLATRASVRRVERSDVSVAAALLRVGEARVRGAPCLVAACRVVGPAAAPFDDPPAARVDLGDPVDGPVEERAVVRHQDDRTAIPDHEPRRGARAPRRRGRSSARRGAGDRPARGAPRRGRHAPPRRPTAPSAAGRASRRARAPRTRRPRARRSRPPPIARSRAERQVVAVGALVLIRHKRCPTVDSAAAAASSSRSAAATPVRRARRSRSVSPGRRIGLLRQVGDRQRRRIQRDGPAVGCLLAREQAQDRRLPDAVRADEADAGVRADLEGGVLEHDLGSVGLRDAGEAGAHDGVTS